MKALKNMNSYADTDLDSVEVLSFKQNKSNGATTLGTSAAAATAYGNNS